jgi:hypothetical protein
MDKQSVNGAAGGKGCSKLGRYKGLRERELIGRRGPVAISELELAADHIRETLDLDRFWARRPSSLHPMRCYQTAA